MVKGCGVQGGGRGQAGGRGKREGKGCACSVCEAQGVRRQACIPAHATVGAASSPSQSKLPATARACPRTTRALPPSRTRPRTRRPRRRARRRARRRPPTAAKARCRWEEGWGARWGLPPLLASSGECLARCAARPLTSSQLVPTPRAADHEAPGPAGRAAHPERRQRQLGPRPAGGHAGAYGTVHACQHANKPCLAGWLAELRGRWAPATHTRST